MIDYLEKGKPINGQHYVLELRQLQEAIKSERWGKLRVDLLQDNVLVHTAQDEKAEATKCDVELLLHPLYAPDLILFDVWLCLVQIKRSVTIPWSKKYARIIFILISFSDIEK